MAYFVKLKADLLNEQDFWKVLFSRELVETLRAEKRIIHEQEVSDEQGMEYCSRELAVSQAEELLWEIREEFLSRI